MESNTIRRSSRVKENASSRSSFPFTLQVKLDDSKKTAKDHSKAYRDKIKQDPTKYKAYRQAENERHRQYRQSLSEEKKQHVNELQRIRQKRYRGRIKDEGLVATHRSATREVMKIQAEKRARNSASAKKMRDNYTPQKRTAVNKKRMDRYYAKKFANLQPSSPPPSSSPPVAEINQQLASSTLQPPASPSSINQPLSCSLEDETTSPSITITNTKLPTQLTSSSSSNSNVDVNYQSLHSSSSPSVSLTDMATTAMTSPSFISKKDNTCQASPSSSCPTPVVDNSSHVSSPTSMSKPFPTQNALRCAIYRQGDVLRNWRGPRLAQAIKHVVHNSDSPTKRAVLQEGISLSPTGKELKEAFGNLMTDLSLKRDKGSIKLRRSIVEGLPPNLLTQLKVPVYSTKTPRPMETLYKKKDSSQKVLAKKCLFENAIPDPCMKGVSKRTGLPRMVLCKSMIAIHRTFSKENGSGKASMRSFYRHRQKNICTVSKLKFRQCLCDICYNPEKKLEALKKALTMPNLNIEEVVEFSLCAKEGAHHKIVCVRRECPQCGVNAVRKMLNDRVNELNVANDDVTFHQWKYVDENGSSKMEKVREKIKIMICIERFCAELHTLCLHKFTDNWQRTQFSMLKDNLPRGSVLIVMDFAENYSCRQQDEAQSAYYSINQVTLHPIVCYFKCRSCENHLVTYNFGFISNDLKHDSHIVKCFFDKCLSFLQEKIMLDKVFVFSDGAASQYKSKFPLYYLSKSKSTVAVHRAYFGSRHGKSPCDSLGGVIKSCLKTLIKNDDEILVTNAKSMYETCKRNLEVKKLGLCGEVHTIRTFMFIDSSEVERIDSSLIKTVPGTRTLHHAKFVSPRKISVRQFACFCTYCTTKSLYSECPNQSIVGSWREIEFEEPLRVGSFHSTMWNNQNYIAQIMQLDGTLVKLNFLQWRNGKVCKTKEDESWENRDVVGAEVVLTLDERMSTNRMQLFSYSFKM